jgi:hypothetical protein
MIFLAIVAIGFASAYFTVWSAMTFNNTLEERVSNLLFSVIIDVILLVLLTISSSGFLFTQFLIGKYLFLAAIDFDKTLRQ